MHTEYLFETWNLGIKPFDYLMETDRPDFRVGLLEPIATSANQFNQRPTSDEQVY